MRLQLEASHKAWMEWASQPHQNPRLLPPLPPLHPWSLPPVNPVSEKAPKRLYVLGQEIEVRLEHNPTHEGHALLGHYTSDQSLIVLNDSMAPERARVTIVHEALHALLDATGLDNLLSDHEEDLVSRLAPTLLSFLRENPDLLFYLEAV